MNKSLFLIFGFIFFLSSCSRLDYHKSPTPEKLDKYFNFVKKVQTKLLKHSISGKKITRTELNEMLNSSPVIIQKKDLENLAKFHKQLEEKNKRSFEKKSVIALESIKRDSVRLNKFCREIPKGGLLHIHPGGTLSLNLIEDLLSEINPRINSAKLLKKANDGVRSKLEEDEVDFIKKINGKEYLDLNKREKKELVKLFSLDPKKKPFPFERFQSIFSIKRILYSSKKNKKMVKEKMHLDFLKRAKENNVLYVEYTKVMDAEKGTLQKIKKMSDQLFKKTGVHVRWIWAFIRDRKPEKNRKEAKKLINLLKRKKSKHPLVGIDLLANEKNHPAFEAGQSIYLPILDQVNKGKISLSRTMHAGELGLLQNVRDGILLGSNRVGHGVLAQNDPLTLELMRRNQIAIDINLSSNLYLGVVENIKRHPFLFYLRMGIPVSLSTDDEGMFNTDISKECIQAVKNTDINYGELKAMSYNSIKYSFAEKRLKIRLLSRLKKQFNLFEKSWISSSSK